MDYNLVKELVVENEKLEQFRRKYSIFASSLDKNVEQVKVQICVQFFKVGEIDTLKEQFTADVVVKAKWREPSLDGQSKPSDAVDFGKMWNPKLYIENSLGDPKEQLRYRILYNDKGEAFVSEKRVIKGTFMENLELDDFPFDVQDLTITVASELPSYEVELIEDQEDHHVVNKQSFVDEQEWHLYVHTECSRRDIVIDQADNSVRRSALSVKCRAARRPGYFVWNIFMVTFLICSLSFATFSVGSSKPENRLQLSFTLVLTAVAFKSVVNNSLPRISYLTYMDKYLLASMIMLSAVCAWHAIVTTLHEENAKKTEPKVLIVLGVIYVLYNIGFVIIIYLYPWRKRRIMTQKDRDYKLYRTRITECIRLRRIMLSVLDMEDFLAQLVRVTVKKVTYLPEEIELQTMSSATGGITDEQQVLKPSESIRIARNTQESKPEDGFAKQSKRYSLPVIAENPSIGIA